MEVGPTLIFARRRWINFEPTYIVCEPYISVSQNADS